MIDSKQSVSRPAAAPRDTFLEYAGQRFHYLWLRDNCRCGHCLHPSGQRLHETWQLDPGIRPRRVQSDDTALHILWEDGHESRYAAEFLARCAYDRRTFDRPVPRLWSSDLDTSGVTFGYAQVAADKRARLAWLQAVRDHGFAFLTGVPTEPGTILQVIDLFGFVRETNYGRVFEVISEPQPVNLAYTPMPLSLHTDNPYRDPVPTLQLLHCLKAAEAGGVTALADGFRAAELLREDDPDAFRLLATVPVNFRFRGEQVDLQHRDTMIGLDSGGGIRSIRVNNRSAAPVDVPFEHMEDFYRAYQRFMSLLQEGGCKITFRMQAGDLVLLDNQRVLHGREEQALGERHLQGAYADRDNLLSVLRVLERERYND